MDFTKLMSQLEEKRKEEENRPNEFEFNGKWYDRKYYEFSSLFDGSNASSEQINYLVSLREDLHNHSHYVWFKENTKWLEDIRLERVDLILDEMIPIGLIPDILLVDSLIKFLRVLLNNMNEEVKLARLA